MCLWDMLTWQEELWDMQEVEDVLHGRIFWRTPYYYQTRLDYTRPMLWAGDVAPARYDDAAVSLEKLGRVDEAIGLIVEKDDRFPELYETYANHGTFLAHQRRFPEALEKLERAVDINPDAHFGREYVQIDAIHYMLDAARDSTLPERKDIIGIDLAAAWEHFDPNEDALEDLDLEDVGVRDDVPVALAAMIQFGGRADLKMPVHHLWFSLGTSLTYADKEDSALRAFHRAHVEGHPLALDFGRRLYGNASAYSWQMLTQRYDEDFARGQRWVAQEQERVDRRLHAGDLGVFGY